MVTDVTYQDGMGMTIRQQSDAAITDYSYDLSGNAVTEYVQTGANEGILTLHVVDKDGNETATLQNPVWNAASGCFDVGADTICETAGYDKSACSISSLWKFWKNRLFSLFFWALSRIL